MEVFNPYELETNESENQENSPICEIQGGKKFPFWTCMVLTMRLLWKKILASSMTTLLILFAFDIFFWFMQTDITTLYMVVDISISVFLVLLNFILSWILYAKRMQRTTGAGTTAYTRIYPTYLEVTPSQPVNNPMNPMPLTPMRIYFEDVQEIKETKQAYLIINNNPNLPQGQLLFIILNDERVNEAARSLFHTIAEEKKNRN